MGRRGLYLRLMSFLGMASVARAGVFGHTDLSFLSSESSHYSPVSSYYVAQPSYSTSHTYIKKAPVATTTFVSSSPIYVKSPVYYPESSVFSDPLPIISLPQLPAEFLTLKSAEVATVKDAKASKKGRKGRRGGKMTPATTPAPVEEEEEEEEDVAQETEGEPSSNYGVPPQNGNGNTEASNSEQQSGASSEGGYPGGNQQGGSTGSTEGATGGYSGSQQQGSATESNQGGYSSSGNSGRSVTQARSNNDDVEETEADEDVDEADEIEEERMEQVMAMRGRKSNRNSGRAQNSIATVELEEGFKIPTIYVPTFGNNVLNTVYPAYSQNVLLRSLEGTTGAEESYPDSGMDVSSVSIASEGRKSRKSKKRTSPRKSRQGRRGRVSARRNEPSTAPEATQPTSPPQQENPQNGQSQAYGPPQFAAGAPLGGYSSSQQRQGLSPPPQSESNFNTINAQTAALIEPRRMSQTTLVADGNNQFPVSGGNNDQSTAELIRTVQAILRQYPN